MTAFRPAVGPVPEGGLRGREHPTAQLSPQPPVPALHAGG